MLQRLLKLKYIIFFLLILHIILSIFLFIHDTNEKRVYLQNKTDLSLVEYQTIYSKIKEQSEMIFQEQINTKDIIDIFKHAYLANNVEKTKIRDTLYNKLEPSYTRLQKLINLKQVHFHLPNNHSFLRMHRKNKFGDDLTGIRETVMYVNKFKKRIDGFEEGRVYNGFRFVYPLFDESQQHIGSVEVSFSALSFQKTLSNVVRFSQFIFAKDITDKKVWKDEYAYKPSAISPMFLLESNWEDSTLAPIKRKIMEKISPEIKEVFQNNLFYKKAYSTSVEVDKITRILSFLPVKNPVNNNLVAYLVIVTDSAHIYRSNLENQFLILLSFAFLLSLFIIIYRQSKYEEDIQEQHILLMEQSKMAQMGSMLSNIAHQWKQPLTQINAKLIEMPLSLSLTQKDAKTLDTYIEDIENFTAYMADTIENFKTYFHPDKQKNYFDLSDTLTKLLHLVDLPPSIEILIESTDETRLYCFENELLQVLITLLINAKEALIQNGTTSPQIKILVNNKFSKIEISVIDNAGGIENENIKQIFNPYFSTKKNNENTGIGLYMAKMIVEGMQGSLTYKKINSESHFQITLKGIKYGK